jgi:signal transduction histidine kinase
LKSIKQKLIASTFILVAAIVVFTLVYFPLQQKRQAFLALENELEVLCETLALTIALGFAEDNYQSMQVAFDFVKRDPVLEYIAVYGVDEELIAAFPDPLPGGAEPIVTPGLVEGPEAVAYCSAVVLQGEAYGFVTISRSLSSFNQSIADSRYDTLLIGLLILALSLGLAYLIARMVAEPLNLLTGATQRVARGEYSVRVDIDRKDETGTLATNFNRMTDALQTHTEELSRASEAAEAANRAKSTFLANMSHEIRTPMNAILGFTQIVNNDSDLDDRHRKSVRIIRQSGEHLLKLINDILDISKIEAGHEQLNRSEFDLKVMVEGLGDMFGMRCQQTGLVWELESEVPAGHVEGDEGKLRQVLINLVGNAVKFTETGTVKLKVGALGDDRYAFEVRDTVQVSRKRSRPLFLSRFSRKRRAFVREGPGWGWRSPRAVWS